MQVFTGKRILISALREKTCAENLLLREKTAIINTDITFRGRGRMSFALVLSLLGGLALFLYGMQMMSSGLEAVAGNKMKRVLEKLTTNRLIGVGVGAGVTAVIQSSSATTVMVVGFVNSKMLTLKQAVWIIMGANIGTTVTGLLIALDVGLIAPLLAFLGVAVVVFVKRASLQHCGQILAGLGILFIGMEMMSSAMLPLRDSETFIRLMTSFSNPLLGILAGALFTAVIQSSSAAVGILQALAKSEFITLSNAVYVLFGMNIGTCITAVLASIGMSRNAKRTTIIHLMFNIIGTVIFTVICLVTPLTSFIETLVPDNAAMQIANIHTLFNVTTTLILLPFGGYLAALAVKILPEKESEKTEGFVLQYLKPIKSSAEYRMGNAAIATNGIVNEMTRMSDFVGKNVERSFDAVLSAETENVGFVTEDEEYIDFLNKEIAKYISKVLAYESNPDDCAAVTAYFKICGDLERIGDHAMNICDYGKLLKDKKISFSEKAKSEILNMKEVTIGALKLLGEFKGINGEKLEDIKNSEQKIDDMTREYRANQITRMRNGECSDEACVLYSEMLTDFERMGDHILNIGEQLAVVKG